MEVSADFIPKDRKKVVYILNDMYFQTLIKIEKLLNKNLYE